MAIHVPEEQAPLRTTREMLDELDMLLQRMLRVPVDEPGKPTGPRAWKRRRCRRRCMSARRR
jgi:hypothetical protein